MKLIKLPNELLRQKSKEVKLPLSSEDERLVRKLIEIVDNSQKGEGEIDESVGIAAIQLGHTKRMFYMNVEDNGQSFRDVLINPIVIGESPSYASLEGGEGCLSVGKDNETEGLVHRKFKIVIEAYSYFLKSRQQFTFTSYFAIVAQHELDHLNGILFVDRISKRNPWKKISSDEVIVQ